MKTTLHEGTGRLEFSFTGDFKKDFLDDLKDEIATEYRSYDPDNHIWTIYKPAWPVFRAVYKRHYIGENQEELEF